MAFEMGTMVTGLAVGGIDEAALWWDQRQGLTRPFQNFTDIYRVIAVLGGYGLAAFMPRWNKQGTTIAVSATPLLTKSVIQTIRGAMGVSSFAPASRGKAGAPAGSVGRTYEPQFREAGAV